LPLEHCIVAKARWKWYLLDINIYFLSTKYIDWCHVLCSDLGFFFC
jgi:hypothetical protein